MKKTQLLFFALALIGLVGFVPSTRCSQREGGQAQTIEISVEEAQALLDTLEAVLATRAPRENVAGGAVTPISPFNSALLDSINRCVCMIKNQLEELTGDTESRLDFICEKIGEGDAVGSCFPAIVTEADIDNATDLNVIEWLKSIMKDIRGVCP